MTANKIASDAKNQSLATTCAIVYRWAERRDLAVSADHLVLWELHVSVACAILAAKCKSGPAAATALVLHDAAQCVNRDGSPPHALVVVLQAILSENPAADPVESALKELSWWRRRAARKLADQCRRDPVGGLHTLIEVIAALKAVERSIPLAEELSEVEADLESFRNALQSLPPVHSPEPGNVHRSRGPFVRRRLHAIVLLVFILAGLTFLSSVLNLILGWRTNATINEIASSIKKASPKPGANLPGATNPESLEKKPPPTPPPVTPVQPSTTSVEQSRENVPPIPIDQARKTVQDCVRAMLDSSKAHGVIVSRLQRDRFQTNLANDVNLLKLWSDFYIAYLDPSNEVDLRIPVEKLQGNKLFDMVSAVTTGKPDPKVVLPEFARIACPAQVTTNH